MSLPYVTPPAPKEKRTVGNNKTGRLEIEVFGGLTTEESAIIDELLMSQQKAHVVAAQLAKRISDAEVIKSINDKGETVSKRLTLVEAYLIVNNSVFGRDQAEGGEEISLKYTAELDELSNLLTSASNKRREAAVTALIRTRLDRPRWGIKDTRRLPKELTGEIYALIQEEEQASSSDEVNPPTEEELGKQQPESKPETKSTGPKSSTNSPQVTPDSSAEKPSTKS